MSEFWSTQSCQFDNDKHETVSLSFTNSDNVVIGKHFDCGKTECIVKKISVQDFHQLLLVAFDNLPEH